MRAPQWVSEFFEWRWAPCIGLTAGSLAFVAFALVLIPTHFGEARVVSALNALEAAQPQRAIFSSALPRPETGGSSDDHRAELARNARIARAVSPPVPRGPEATAPVQRGFSPVLERPEPLTPPPAPPPLHVPAPVATLTAAVAVPPAVPANPSANASAEPPAPVPGSVAVIQPEAGGPAREVTNQ